MDEVLEHQNGERQVGEGSDHYQVMKDQAILRFWTLTACLMCFLEEQRATMDYEGHTCGDIRRQIQADHRRSLLAWLEAQFTAGQSAMQLSKQLAL